MAAPPRRWWTGIWSSPAASRPIGDAQGPASDRFYAFDKTTGQAVWASTPGARPKDNSYSHPVLAWLEGRRVFYAATGDGAVVCVNARTGEPIFRVPIFKAGINASVLLHKDDEIIAIYGTPYEPGQMVGLKIPHVTPTNAAEPVIVPRAQVELWDNEIRTSASSPILVGRPRVRDQRDGYLVAVDALTGKLLWRLQAGHRAAQFLPALRRRQNLRPDSQ